MKCKPKARNLLVTVPSELCCRVRWPVQKPHTFLSLKSIYFFEITVHTIYYYMICQVSYTLQLVLREEASHVFVSCIDNTAYL
jgi:hypothetical protein